MIYLDYAATTPVNKEVLESFNQCCLNYIGNPNSLHKLGMDAKRLIEQATDQIASILGVKRGEIIYTSGSSESNNLAIKGIALQYGNRGKHIITDKLEHSSIYGPLGYLQGLGYEVDFVHTDQNGRIDLEHLRSLMKDTTILVSISSVNSETGVIQPIEEIGKIIAEYPKCFFHTDMTQSIGKFHIPLDHVDLASFSGQKIYGLKGIGGLIKKEKIQLEPLIHGGKSTTIYRSGTPALPLIVSLSKALRLVYQKLEENYQYVSTLREQIVTYLKTYPNLYINSNVYSVPHIINFSVLGIKPETLLHALEQKEVYISTQSACASGNVRSEAVYEVTKDEQRALFSVRLSLSPLTTEDEIEQFFSIFDQCYHHLMRK